MTLRHRRDVNVMYVTTANKSGGEAVVGAGAVRALEEKRMRDGFGERIVWGLGTMADSMYNESKCTGSSRFSAGGTLLSPTNPVRTTRVTAPAW